MSAAAPTSQGLQLIKGHYIATGTPDAVLIKGAIYQSDSAATLYPSIHRSYLITPYSGTPNNSAFTGQTIQFQIPPNLIQGRIRHMALYYGLVETGGSSSVTPASAPYLCQYIFTGLNGQQSTIFNQLFALQFYANLAYKTYESLINMNGGSLNLLNMNVATFQGESAIPPGGYQQIVQTLESSLLTKIAPNTVGANLWVSVVLPSSQPVIAGSGTLALYSCNLQIWSECNDIADAEFARALSQKPYIINCLHDFVQQFTQTMSANTSAFFPLTSLASAKASTILVTIQAAATAASYTSGGIRTFVNIGGTAAGADASQSPGSIDIRTASGQSIVAGNNNELPFFVSSVSSAMTGVPGYQPSTIPLYQFYLADNNGDPYDVDSGVGYDPGFYRSGNWSGGFVFQGTENLVITPGTSFSSGSYTVTVIAMTIQSFQQWQGQFQQLC